MIYITVFKSIMILLYSLRVNITKYIKYEYHTSLRCYCNTYFYYRPYQNILCLFN